MPLNRHVNQTSDIGDFVITSVTGGHQGIKSIVAVTGDAAREVCDVITIT